MAVVGAPEVQQAPPLAPPWGNLLAVADVVEHDDERFLNGIRYSPENCADLEIWPLCAARSEVQTLTMTGGPTGGTFTLTFRGATTTALAWNATAAQVAAALNALSTIGAGGVTATGGPFPGAAVVVTFVGLLVQGDVPMLVPVDVLTAAGDVVAVETTKGATGSTMAGGGNRGASLEAQPFIVVARDSCSTFGWQAAEYEARARRALQAKESAAIEAELWLGSLGNDNPRLARGQAALATGLGLRRSLATLVQALADGNAGRGMIHARPLLVELWWGLGLLRVEANRLVTGTGHYVIPGAGYPGSGPAGQAIVGAVEWAYATDAVVVHRGPVHVDPEDDQPDGDRIADATNPVTNAVEFRAQRGAVALYNTCVNAPVSVDTAVE